MSHLVSLVDSAADPAWRPVASRAQDVPVLVREIATAYAPFPRTASEVYAVDLDGGPYWSVLAPVVGTDAFVATLVVPELDGATATLVVDGPLLRGERAGGGDSGVMLAVDEFHKQYRALLKAIAREFAEGDDVLPAG